MNSFSSSIHPLPPEVASQIAAGEIIERPFSVIKELVENSLDAGSRKIEIFLEQGGKKRIQIQDDGRGMNPHEMKLALQRHATSKVSAFEDLFSLSTLGFRGEALPSIASISKMTLTSSSREYPLNSYRIVLEGEEIVEESPFGHPIGTTIEVKDLFFNTPARLKFLRSETAEWGQIEDYLMAMGLAYPEVKFTLFHNGKKKIEWTQTDLPKRILEIWGKESNEQFYPLLYEAGEFRLSGYLGHPNLSQFRSGGMIVFVNRRFVKDRLLHHAIVEGYRSLLMKEQNPLGVLFFDLPPDQLDVNVHPTKREIKFENPNSIHTFISQSIKDFFGRAPWKEKPSAEEKSIFSSSVKEPAESFSIPVIPTEKVDNLLPLVFLSASASDSGSFDLDQKKKEKEDSKEKMDAPSVQTGAEKLPQKDLQQKFFPVGRLPFQKLKLIGQLHSTYLLAESDEHLVLIDQHAAHERIGFEKLRRLYLSGSLPSQQLLLSQMVEVKEEEVELIASAGDLLEKMGLQIVPFGPSSVLVRSVPVLLGKINPASLVQDLIRELKTFGTVTLLQNQIEDCLATIACHRQIRAGDNLNMLEMEQLIRDLDEGAYSYHCPHGRPVMVQIHSREIEKWFKRVV